MLPSSSTKDYFIVEYKDVNLIPILVKLAQGIKKFSLTDEQFALWLLKNLGSQDVKLHLVIKNDQIAGFAIAGICRNFTQPFIRIDFAYSPPDIRDGVDKYMTQLEEWGKQMGITQIKLVSPRKGFQHKYGFKVESFTFVKTVGEGK